MYASVNILIIFTPKSPALSSHCEGDLMIRASFMITHIKMLLYEYSCLYERYRSTFHSFLLLKMIPYMNVTLY